MTITLEQARALGAHLADRHGATVVEPTDTISVGARALLTVLAHLSPVLQDVADEIEFRARSVSVTLPSPAGAIVVLSESAVADPVRYASTVCHEMQHAQQLDEAGAIQGSIDYVVSAELRARAEADAYAAGVYVCFLLTGIAPSIEALMSLSSDLYHLAPEEVDLARGIIASHLATIRGGICPPIQAALEAMTWLRLNAPDSIAEGIL